MKTRPKTKPTPKELTPEVLVIDPTVESAPVVINDVVYRLCFRLRDIAQAEHDLRAAGYDVNLLQGFTTVNVETTLILFPALLRKFHPEIGYERAGEILEEGGPRALMAVAAAIVDAWNKTPTKSDDKNPTKVGD